MADLLPLSRGAFVSVTFAGETLPAFVALVSGNGKSIILLFDGMLGGYVQTMPVSWSDEAAHYVDLVEQQPVQLQVMQRGQG